MAGARVRRRWLVHLAAVVTVLLGGLVAAPTASAADPGLLSPCNARSGFGGFGGAYYCSVSVTDVKATRYGTGKRVYVTGNIEVSTDTSITVSEIHWSNDCPPGKYCGQLLTVWFDDLTVQTPGWSGVRRPKQYYLVRLYGTTANGTLTPTGYVRTTYCGPRWELCF